MPLLKKLQQRFTVIDVFEQSPMQPIAKDLNIGLYLVPSFVEKKDCLELHNEATAFINPMKEYDPKTVEVIDENSLRSKYDSFQILHGGCKCGSKCPETKNHALYDPDNHPVLARFHADLHRNLGCGSGEYMHCLLYTSPSPRDS